MRAELDDLFDILDCEDESAASYRAALTRVEELANRGSLDAAEAIAEIYAFSEQYRDAAKAYFWYHVTLARRGYSTTFANKHGAGDPYAGATGDFRNESQVSDLVEELGEDRVHELDQDARRWLDGDELTRLLAEVVDERTFLAFVRVLVENSMDDSAPGWENATISGFLEAASAWAQDSEFGRKQNLTDSSPWRLFAEFLYAGKIYE